MTDQNPLIAFYETYGQEDYRLQKDSIHYVEFITAMKYFRELFPRNAKILDNCAGSGVYAFHLAELKYRVTAGDIVPLNVEIMQKKQAKTPLLQEIYLGNTLNMSQFPDESFDVVLCMGAFYHLQTEDERLQALKENLRVLKKGGIFVASYMNRYGVILGDSEGDLDNLEEIIQFADTGVEGIFYASTPKEMERFFTKNGLEKIKHIALDGMSIFMMETAKRLNQKGFQRWIQYHLKVCEEESLLGSSYHGMWIGRKS